MGRIAPSQAIKLRHWSKNIEEKETSGLSLKAYCLKIGKKIPSMVAQKNPSGVPNRTRRVNGFSTGKE